MKLKEARAIAEELLATLAPAFEQLHIAGSIRREKPEVDDIELVGVPIWSKNLFGEPTGKSERLDSLLWELIERHVLGYDAANPRNGPKYKRLVIRGKDISVDLFLAEPDNFGNIFVIQTGDSEFRKRLVSAWSFGGLMPFNISQRDGYLWRGGERLSCKTEMDFFNALSLEWIEPKDRNFRTIEQIREARSKEIPA